tara:strand:- start:4938 stop:5078 length:141 start_codon:yes stop_codon:yes gene_type:complete
MKLQKILSRNYKGKKYYKYLLVIPEELIKKFDLKAGDKVDIQLKKI